MSETPEAIARRLHNMQCLVWDSCAAVDECECRDAIASAIAAERATRDELVKALREVVRVLESDKLSIVDTVWCTGGNPETLYDHCLAALARAGASHE